ncbi:T9SS type A sorting domain-containing protein [Mariniflexile gromovii]|uniref:T9SS type A sorting domain-containing protein n=1 Tax=Mariniflexile gromovii TaxID=362523 RepID=A0ABS4BT34_9FLAO|nr:T9SS type A sorting domain-containing protein [Mariniflexile gromovii]MBP0903754.1 T9SS type A sorting domain-containing protein [Mariniflexile gromovii]
MKKSIFICSFILLFHIGNVTSQTVLNANGPGNTYELINSVLAPGYDVIEAPDCAHTAFGRHIDEIFDADLNTNVFRFNIHVTPDNDRCTSATDRQRNEIKVYDKSPNNLKAVEGETFVYKWKFKLDAGFQSSSSFTHIHQLKSVGGLYEDMPMYTLTTYKGTPDRLALRYAETNSQTTIKQTDLTPFKGVWVDVTETIKYGTSGTYSIEIKKVSDGTSLFNYSNNAIINWQTGADFVRPKWGIYRSLLNSVNLRDESVLFANFSIEENPTLSTSHNELNRPKIKIIPNPTNNNKLVTINYSPNSVDTIHIYDNLGRLISSLKPHTNTVDVTNFKAGIYFFVLKKDTITISTEKLIIQ